MVENRNKTILQKLKTWWHDLPHKWFFVLQILLSFYPLLFVIYGYSKISIGLVLLLLCLFLCCVLSLYGWKRMFTACYAGILYLLSLFTSLAIISNIEGGFDTYSLALIMIPFGLLEKEFVTTNIFTTISVFVIIIALLFIGPLSIFLSILAPFFLFFTLAKQNNILHSSVLSCLTLLPSFLLGLFNIIATFYNKGNLSDTKYFILPITLFLISLAHLAFFIYFKKGLNHGRK